jgi:hypothetical protein
MLRRIKTLIVFAAASMVLRFCSHFVYSCIPHSPYMGWAHIFIRNTTFMLLFVHVSCKRINLDSYMIETMKVYMLN